MYVTQLNLTDFRSYVSVDVALEPGVVVFIGPNGQGKTNLVEAVEYIATGSSHRVSSDTPLVRLGAEQAVVQVRVRAGVDDARQLALSLEVNPGRANRARLNRAPVRPRELLGALRVVLFSPEDLAIVKGDPADRRRFIDDLLVTRWPRLAGVRADYDRVIRQRSTLLKSLSGRSGRAAYADTAGTLDAWDEQAAVLGAELIEARLLTVHDLEPLVAAQYLAIAPTNNEAMLRYRSGVHEAWSEPDAAVVRADIADILLTAMRHRRAEEIARGVCLVGPHRDDIVFTLGAMPAKGYASHGEAWSLALSLRLGSLDLLRADGIEPVLILDDVFAELDTTRRDRLATTVLGADQVLITAAVPDDVPDVLRGQRFTVGGGSVHEDGNVHEDGADVDEGKDANGDGNVHEDGADADDGTDAKEGENSSEGDATRDAEGDDVHGQDVP